MNEDTSISDSTATDQQQHEQSSRRPLWICGGIVLVLVAATAYVNLVHSRALHISKETTYITEPLKSDGKQVDYFAALQKATYPPDIATENNGFRLLVQHLGPSPNTSPEHFASLCDQLGLDAKSIRPDTTYQDPREYLESYCGSNTFDQAFLDSLPAGKHSADDIATLLQERLRWPWTLDELPMMKQWLEDNSPALDLMSEVVRKPTFYVPMVRQSEDAPLWETCYEDLLHLRTLAHGLSVRANHRIAVGHIDSAIDDIVICKRLGRHVGHGPMCLDLRIGLGIEETGGEIGIAGALKHSPDREQLQRLVHELDNLPPEATADNAVLSRRFRLLDLIQTLSEGKTALHHGWDIPEQVAALGVDWNIFAQQFNKNFDNIVATGHRPGWPSLTTSLVLRCFSLRARSVYLADRWSSCTCSSLGNLLQSRWSATCHHQMRQISLAMLLYERDQGMLPPAWSVDSEGNPLHSWRVLLLPYLGHETLYKKIRLDEPWNSAHNRQFHGEEMAVYRCPSNLMAGPGQTTYSVVVGPDMPFEAGHGKRLADFGPNSDDMILLVERIDPICWMDPANEMTQAMAEKWTDWLTSTSPVMGMGSLPTPVFNDCYGCECANFGLRNGAAVGLDTTESKLGAMLRGTNTEKFADWQIQEAFRLPHTIAPQALENKARGRFSAPRVAVPRRPKILKAFCSLAHLQNRLRGSCVVLELSEPAGGAFAVFANALLMVSFHCHQTRRSPKPVRKRLKRPAGLDAGRRPYKKGPPAGSPGRSHGQQATRRRTTKRLSFRAQLPPPAAATP